MATSERLAVVSDVVHVQGDWLATSPAELRACRSFDDESTVLWRAAPGLAGLVRSADPEEGTRLLAARIATDDSDAPAEVAGHLSSIAVIGASVLERPEIMMVLELSGRILLVGERAGWTAALLLMRDSAWIRAASRDLRDELADQSGILSAEHEARATITADGLDQRLIVVSGSSVTTGEAGGSPESHVIAGEVMPFLISQIEDMRVRASGVAG